MIIVGYLLSYDYELIFESIKLVYNDVDKIYLAADSDNKTWSGNTFVIQDEFFIKINELDKQNKIIIYKDKFYISNLSPMECEIRQRNLLLKKMGKGWLIQLDADEYIYDFKTIKQLLKKNNYLTWFIKKTPVILRGKLITLFKKTKDGYLYIENNESIPFITNYPLYEGARRNNSIRNINIEANVIHLSWAREESEIEYKIKNWGHRDDFDTNNFYAFWKNIDENNYQEIKNFHPLVPHVWNELKFLPANNITDFIEVYSKENPQKLTRVLLKNKMGFVLNQLKFFFR